MLVSTTTWHFWGSVPLRKETIPARERHMCHIDLFKAHLGSLIGIQHNFGVAWVFTEWFMTSFSTHLARWPLNIPFKGNELAVSGIFINKIRALGDFGLKGRHLELSDPNSRLFQQYFDF
ncbi:hypothetical protein CRV24_005316 [Beauveria bassiana]|nr:hypothetical protein CRV24_005316 [Beauveria bassiana]